MPFLTLNNITIPTMKSGDAGGEVVIKEFGERTNAYDGTYLMDIRSRKTQWTFKTKPIPPITAQMLRGLILGQSNYFPLDTGYNSSSGMTPAAGTSGTVIRSALSSIGALQVVDENGTTEQKVGSGSASFQRAVTNLLNLAQSQGTSTAVYTALNGSTLTSVGTQAWTSTTSLQVTSVGAGGAVICNNAGGGGVTITGAIGDIIYVSCYAKANTAGTTASLGIYNRTTAATISTTGPVTFASVNVWQRMVLQFTLVAAATDITLIFAVTAAATTFFIDGLQMEKQTAPGTANIYAGSWVPGGTTVPLANLSYNFNPLGDQGLSFSAWVTKPLQAATPAILLNVNNSIG